MTIVTVLGTRPEIIKLAPLVKELDKRGDHVLVDSGQHYDYIMDRAHYAAMDLRDADYRFDLRGSTPVEQISETMVNCRDVLTLHKTELVVVVGDPNTALAGALVANKLGVPIAHVEAGLRSYDRRMPEEHNRVMIDHISDLLFAPSGDAVDKLAEENIRWGVHMVGNTVTDALLSVLPRVRKVDDTGPYAVVTMHRAENMVPSTVDGVFRALRRVSEQMNVVLLAHPRLRNFVREKRISTSGVRLHDPVDYMEMLSLVQGASVVLTDSGGLQEEACFLRVPCVTLRQSTERPETVAVGANRLALESDEIFRATQDAVASSREWPYPYGDGTSAKMISRIIEKWLP